MGLPNPSALSVRGRKGRHSSRCTALNLQMFFLDEFPIHFHFMVFKQCASHLHHEANEGERWAFEGRASMCDICLLLPLEPVQLFMHVTWTKT